jgi:signal peptidase I
MREALMNKARRMLLSLGFKLLPVALTVVVMRWLMPPVEQPVMVAALVLLVFVALAEYWSRVLVGAPPPVARRRTSTLVAVGVAALAAIAFGQAFRAARVLSTSMVPTILPHDRLWVDKLLRRHAPRRGEVIVFRHRGDGGDDGEGGALVKRVIGLPGDRVAMNGSRPVLNGQELPSCDAGTFVYFGASKSSRGHLVVEWLEGQPYLAIYEPGPHHFDEYVVKPGELFVLGDNRGVSNDSRSWRDGAGVPLQDIEGRVAHVLFGADRAGRLDPARLWRRLGTELHVTGVNIDPLRAGIERCLQGPPAKYAQQS